MVLFQSIRFALIMRLFQRYGVPLLTKVVALTWSSPSYLGEPSSFYVAIYYILTYYKQDIIQTICFPNIQVSHNSRKSSSYALFFHIILLLAKASVTLVIFLQFLLGGYRRAIMTKQRIHRPETNKKLKTITIVLIQEKKYRILIFWEELTPS